MAKSKKRTSPSRAPVTPEAELADVREDPAAEPVTPVVAEPAPATGNEPQGPVAAGASRQVRRDVGAELARQRRVERAGFTSDRCALLGIELDRGPRSVVHAQPAQVGDLVVSAIGASILAAGLTAEQLEHAAAQLRERG